MHPNATFQVDEEVEIGPSLRWPGISPDQEASFLPSETPPRESLCVTPSSNASSVASALLADSCDSFASERRLSLRSASLTPVDSCHDDATTPQRSSGGTGSPFLTALARSDLAEVNPDGTLSNTPTF